MKPMYSYENKYLRLFVMYPAVLVMATVYIIITFFSDVIEGVVDSSRSAFKNLKHTFSKGVYQLYRDGSLDV